MEVHGPVVAGAFYPADARELRGVVRSLLAQATPPPPAGRLRGLIVPHAALQYSGPVAATGYALLAGTAFRRVVLAGPSHFAWFRGAVTLPASGWRTPLGIVDVRQAAVPDAVAATDPFLREHCLEVQLPFLQELLPGAAITPLLFGDLSPKAGAELISAELDDDTLLVISSDLSHYLTHEEAQRMDRATATAIVERRPEALTPDSACGRRCIQAALVLAASAGWDVTLLDLRTSADTAGDPSRVVGYGAFALTAVT